MFFLDHIWLIPLLPAAGAAIMFFFGRKLQKQTVSAVCVGSVVLAFVMACGAVWQYSGYAHGTGHPYHRQARDRGYRNHAHRFVSLLSHFYSFASGTCAFLVLSPSGTGQQPSAAQHGHPWHTLAA